MKMTSLASRRSIKRRQQRATWPVSRRLHGYGEALRRRGGLLDRIALIYRDQPRVYPAQIEASVDRLVETARLILAAHAYVTALPPAETQRLRPGGCVARLTSLDALLAEVIVTMTIFGEVCQTTTAWNERVQLHLALRERFPALISAYADATALLLTLAEKAEPGHVQDPRGGQ